MSSCDECDYQYEIECDLDCGCNRKDIEDSFTINNTASYSKYKYDPISFTGCIRCGCSAEKDEYGDRICYCATCRHIGGCFRIEYKKNMECITCGCSAEKDKYGDRICYCATCKYNGGCIFRPKIVNEEEENEEEDDEEEKKDDEPLNRLKKVYDRERFCKCIFGDFENVCSDCEKNINMILEKISETINFI